VKRIWIFLALSSAALLIGALISLFFRDWVRDQVVIPIAYLFWVLRLFFLSIPESIFWGILVFIGLVVFLWIYRPVSPKPDPSSPFRPSGSVSRYNTWLRYVSMINSSRFASDNLSRDLIRLTVLTLAYQHSLSTDEVYTQLEHEDLGLPPELHAFVRRRGFQTVPPHETRLMEILHRLLPRRPALRQPGVYTPIEREANQLISQIEHLMIPPDQSLLEPIPEEAVH